MICVNVLLKNSFLEKHCNIVENTVCNPLTEWERKREGKQLLKVTGKVFWTQISK